MPENDLRLLMDAARAAGDIASPFWRQSPKTWEKDAGAGPVTEADLAVDEMLKDRLLAARPDYGWLSEETEDGAARLGKSRVFIIDPIDGTRAFLAGEKTWSHSLAVAENGKITAAVVYLPLRDELFSASIGAGSFLNDAQLQLADRDKLEGATVLSSRPNLDAIHWHGGALPVERHFRSSIAFRLALIAQGRFDAMLTLRDSWEWDVAAGSLIASEAGAGVTDRDGWAPVFNKETPKLAGFFAAPKGIHAQLVERLR